MAYHPLGPEHPLVRDDKPALVAIDLGLRAGFAFYSGKGRLLQYRSTNFGTVTRMKRGIPGSLPSGVSQLVTEGDTHFAELWERVAEKRGIATRRVAPHVWRHALYSPRNLRPGINLKKVAGRYATSIIDWSECSKATSLRHDAAEAICLGLYTVLNLGWLKELPEPIRLP